MAVRHRHGGTCIEGCIFDNCAIDNCGNGIAYDSVGDGGFGNNLFEPAAETNTWQGPKWPGHPLRAGIEFYDVRNLYWRFGHPLTLVDGTQGAIPAIRANQIYNIRYGWPENELENVVTAGNVLFERSGTGGTVQGIEIGEIGGTTPLASGKIVSSTSAAINQFDLIEAKNDTALQLSTNIASSIVLGVALQACGPGDICIYGVSGTASYLKVNNYGATQIASDSLLRPDSAHPGGVQAAASWNDGQIVGRALADIPAGSAGVAELFGVGKL